MKNKITRYMFSILASVAFLCMATATATANDTPKPTKNIVETAVDAGNFTILAKALEVAGLTETLKSGNFTVFAPSDEAFKRLPPGALDNLLNDKEGLRRVLLYHVVEGKHMAADVTKMSELKTMQGAKAAIKVKPEKVKIDRARIVKTDIMASNGVIHVIDRIITPTE